LRSPGGDWCALYSTDVAVITCHVFMSWIYDRQKGLLKKNEVLISKSITAKPSIMNMTLRDYTVSRRNVRFHTVFTEHEVHKKGRKQRSCFHEAKKKRIEAGLSVLKEEGRGFDPMS
jgi:hypothetical protein